MTNEKSVHDFALFNLQKQNYQKFLLFENCFCLDFSIFLLSAKIFWKNLLLKALE